MDIIKKNSIPVNALPGRGVQTAVGKGAPSESQRMTLGWTRYCSDFGPMEPHHHAEETVVVLDAKDAYMRVGPAKDQLGERIPLEADTAVHFPPLEWHVFEYDEGGHLDIMFFYAQVDNIRPEDND